MFKNMYQGKTILVTGHTGFKGSWLSMWLTSLGARVVGYSLYLPSDPCNFTVSELENRITHIEGDIRDIGRLRSVFAKHQPEMVFHLAAQPIVRKSYDQPKVTFDTNVGGTINILECIRQAPFVKAAVMITSDKCYQNLEWAWGYRENDRLGGDDPYSASKACAEIVCRAYAQSFFSKDEYQRISTARAGNVIGGGDWADDRIVPDCIRAFSKGRSLEIRSPNATRPWQHVLEPLSGYLWLGVNLLRRPNCYKVSKEAFNFGPSNDVNRTVKELVSDLSVIWGESKWHVSKSAVGKKESTLLKLNCDKAFSLLKWSAVLSFDETVRMTADWYKSFYANEKCMYDYGIKQINEYFFAARKINMIWAK